MSGSNPVSSPSANANTPPASNSHPGKSILVEAQSLVYGPREMSYDTPAANFQRTVDLINVVLKRKLRTPLEPADFGLIMVCAKLARHAHAPKRDNLVDLAGYAETVSRIEEGR